MVVVAVLFGRTGVAHAGVGRCISGQAVVGENGVGPPTCGTVSGGGINLGSYTGAVGITGNQANGSDQISNVNVNAMCNPLTQAGATADVQINNCVTALPNGGTIDARSYGATTQTIAATVTLGPSLPITLLVDSSTTFSCSITNNTSCFLMYPGAAIIGEMASQSSNAFGYWNATNSASIRSLIEFAGGQGPTIKNVHIGGNPTATVSKAVLYIRNPTNQGEITGIVVGGNKGWAVPELMITNINGTAVGPFNLVNNTVACGDGSTAGCEPVLIKNEHGGLMGSIYFYGGSYVHPASGGHPTIELDGQTNVAIYGIQMESINTGDIGISADNTTALVVDGLIATANTNSGTTIISMPDVLGRDNDVAFRNIYNQGSWTNTIVDTQNSRTITTTGVNAYNLDDAGRTSGPFINNGALDAYFVNGTKYLWDFNLCIQGDDTDTANCYAGMTNSSADVRPELWAYQGLALGGNLATSSPPTPPGGSTNDPSVSIEAPSRGTGNTVQIYTNGWGTALAGISPGGLYIPPTNTIGNLPAWAAGLEGATAVATNCNAACTVGGTCTAGGATHCQVYYNSAAIVETGR